MLQALQQYVDLTSHLLSRLQGAQGILADFIENDVLGRQQRNDQVLSAYKRQMSVECILLLL